jgi:hypothetical protein
MNEERMLKPALTGGVLLGILSSLPLINLVNCICCAWVIGGGILAAYMYVKDSPIPVTLGRGVALGLFTGIIGTIVTVVFSIPLSMLMHNAGMGIVEQIRQAVDQVPDMPPETREAFESFIAREGMGVFFFAASTLVMLVVYSAVAMLGGAIGVALFEKRKQGAPPAGGPTYEPPPGIPPSPPPPPQE